MDGQSLTVADGAFDATASHFGLIFFPDLGAGMAELVRAVRPGGRVAVSAWERDGFSVHRLALEALRSVATDAPLPPPRPAAFRLGAPDALEAALAGAGLRDVHVTRVQHAWPMTDPDGLFRSIPHWSAPLRPVFEALDAAQLARAGVAFRTLAATEAAESDGLQMRALIGVGAR
jgi:SAM-dependent methyltransferase